MCGILLYIFSQEPESGKALIILWLSFPKLSFCYEENLKGAFLCILVIYVFSTLFHL